MLLLSEGKLTVDIDCVVCLIRNFTLCGQRDCSIYWQLRYFRHNGDMLGEKTLKDIETAA